MDFVIATLSMDNDFVYEVSNALIQNFNVINFQTEEEFFIFLEHQGDHIDFAMIDCASDKSFNANDILATISDSIDGWPDIKLILIDDKPATHEACTELWRYAINADYVEYPVDNDSLIAVLSGGLNRAKG